jgi:hypothetical protein
MDQDNENIDAAIYSPTIDVTKSKHISTEDTHNVYAAELTAIQMAITLFEENIDEYTKVHIFTDTQSAIQAVESPKRQWGQYIIEGILDTIDKIHEIKPTTTTTTIHIDGYQDTWISRATNKRTRHQNQPSSQVLSPQYKNEIGPKSINQIMTKNKWEAECKAGRENAKPLRNMGQYHGTTTRLKLYGALQKRKHVIWTTRIRTGHCHLNEYLHRFNIIESPECECAEKQTLDHYLLNCELYDEERGALRRSVGAQGIKTSILPGEPPNNKANHGIYGKRRPFQARSKIIQGRYLKENLWKGKP